jgi:predicted DNA-binding protein YlxM (UPF0122 family)
MDSRVSTLLKLLTAINKVLHGYRRGNRERRVEQRNRLNMLLEQVRVLLSQEQSYFALFFDEITNSLGDLELAAPLDVSRLAEQEENRLKKLGFNQIRRQKLGKIYRRRLESSLDVQVAEVAFTSPERFYQALNDYIESEINRTNETLALSRKQKKKLRERFFSPTFYFMTGSIVVICDQFTSVPIQQVSVSLGVVLIEKSLPTSN